MAILRQRQKLRPGSAQVAGAGVVSDGPIVEEPPDPPVGGIARVQWNDSEGPTWDWANPTMLIPWKTKGGDWLDNNGVPYATGVLTGGLRWIDFNVSDLVTRLLEENTSFFIHGSGNGSPPQFATRQTQALIPAQPTYWNPAKLHISTTTGAFDLVCTADTWMTPTSNSSQHGSYYFSPPGLVKFDLSTVTGTVVTATLSLYAMGVFGTWNLAVDYADFPELLTDPAVQHPELVELGIADTVATDADLADHPSVLAYCGFSSAEEIDGFFNWGGGPVVEYITWTEYPMPAIRVSANTTRNTSYNARTYTVNAPGIRNPQPWMVSSPRQAPQHVFTRYLLRMEDDVPLGVNQGRKLPAASGALTQYVNTSWGVDFFGADNSWGFALDAQLPSAANGNCMGVTPYVYDMNNRMSSPLRGQVIPTGVAFKTSHTYCIEIEVKMNTANGLGGWNEDGVLAVWLDGVEVFRDVTRWWRDTEMANYLTGECLIMHGGNNKPHATIHDQMGGWCIATEYIGPPKKA
jgi:hypothetical protein